MSKTFLDELEELINKHSMENESHTPDFILAQYIADCLEAHTHATRTRDKYYSFKPLDQGMHTIKSQEVENNDD